MPLFAASLESLIVFAVILLLSAVGNWLKNRKGQEPEGSGDEDGPTVPPRRSGQPAPAPAEPGSPTPPVFDLERELRRMFGQEPEPPPAIPPRTPPPVIAPVPAREAPAPPPRPAPVYGEAAGDEFVPVPRPAGTHFPRTSPASGQVGAPDFELAHLAE